jgi:hypothetical protein
MPQQQRNKMKADICGRQSSRHGNIFIITINNSSCGSLQITTKRTNSDEDYAADSSSNNQYFSSHLIVHIRLHYRYISHD